MSCEDDCAAEAILAIVMCVIALVGGIFLGAAACNSSWTEWSINVNAAHYDPTTGNWTEGPVRAEKP